MFVSQALSYFGDTVKFRASFLLKQSGLVAAEVGSDATQSRLSVHAYAGSYTQPVRR